MTKRFLVTGMGRSGTGYVAEVFSRLGLKCGHEKACDRGGWHGFEEGYVGESSGYAPGVFVDPARPEELPEDIDLVIHLVRNPVDWANSMRARLAFITVDDWAEPRLATRWGRDVTLDPWKFWHAWNRQTEMLCGLAPMHMRVRVEEAETWMWRALHLLNADVHEKNWPVVESALAKSTKRRRWDPAPEDFYTEADVADFAREMARRYGYAL